jgi:hypothetical protein
MSRLDVAVALFCYNRPAPTRRVFARIRDAQPARLFVVADGPKSDAEMPAVLETRVVTEQIDWPCDVERVYAPHNLGLGRRLASGFELVLAATGEAIFLEDDCLPNASFFAYCADLLQRYRHTPEVMMISGFNPLATLGEDAAGGPSYDFARFGSIWGWATWQRAFDGYRREPPAADDDGTFERLRMALGDDRAFDYYRRALAQVRNGSIDTWDYQWTLRRLLDGGLAAVPNRNLVENIGFGSGATNTVTTQPLLLGLEAGDLAFPLRHPARIERNPEFDNRLLRHRFGEPVPDDLHAACERLLRGNRTALVLALATEGCKRYPADPRFARLRSEARERLSHAG